MIKRIQDIQGLIREFLKSVIFPGDTVLDLTAGRGRDTLFLAECVGENGSVHAFDIQIQALNETRRLLEEKSLLSRVKLYCLDHALIKEVVREPVKAAVFNLGYLPGSDRKVITRADSTIQALKGVLDLLQTGGLLVLTVYRGHEGGLEEAQQVDGFLSSLPKRDFSVLEGKYLNQGEVAPYWIMVQKTGGT